MENYRITEAAIKEPKGSILLINMDGISTTTFDEIIEGFKNNKISIIKSKITLAESIEVLCNALREDTSEGSLYQDWCYKAAIAFKAEWEKVENNTNIKNASDYKDIISHQAAKNFLNLLISK